MSALPARNPSRRPGGRQHYTRIMKAIPSGHLWRGIIAHTNCGAPLARTRAGALLSALLLAGSVSAASDTIAVSRFRHIGPFALQAPVMLDSTDTQGHRFEVKQLLNTSLHTDQVWDAQPTQLTTLAAPAHKPALHVVAFSFDNARYAKVSVRVKGLKHHRLIIDGKEAPGGATDMLPATHRVVLKALVEAGQTDTLQVALISHDTKAADGLLSLHEADQPDAMRYTLSHVLNARRYRGVSLSANGDYMIVSTSQTKPDGQTAYTTEVRHVATRRVVAQRSDIRWMPRTNQYYYVRTDGQGQRQLVATDPATNAERTLATGLPEGSFVFVPNEQQLIFTIRDEGQREQNADVYEVTHPDDRQPGWRDRSHLALYDLQSGLLQPLTFGHSSTSLADVSADGRYALLMSSASRLTERPTTLFSLYRIDLQTLAIDTLVSRDGFMSGAQFAPDGQRVLLTGSPEAFGGIGKDVRPDQTPSMIDNQLFMMDIGTRHITPLTLRFDPSVQSAEWSAADGQIYFRAEDKDFIRLFRLNPADGSIQRVPVPEDVVLGFSLAAKAPVLACYGQGVSNSDRLYTIGLGKTLTDKRVQLAEDLSADNLKHVQLGTCEPFTYVNPEGDSICCRFYLPPAFDAAKRYPMIVNYYGGCSPTSRTFESRYPQHAYAALGYVVLVVNPRGATGFGQKWSAAHVNTAGQGVAQDIIGAVNAFCQSHPYVNRQKIGCIGASYGGFMTQYLQTQTDLFAAAISHAGISDHTSYWGEGFWGYSYSEVSMANSYPWTSSQLYVEQSPLYNADKIHTPILFLHGTNDNNVPVGESIQMYTALKLLGRPTAMVLVKGEDHHILAYQKRIRWQNTIFAWFARWLQDAPEWWDAMYPNGGEDE